MYVSDNYDIIIELESKGKKDLLLQTIMVLLR